MVANLIGGLLMMTGGSMLSLSSITLRQAQRRVITAREFGDGMAAACADTATAPIPAHMASLLDRIP